MRSETENQPDILTVWPDDDWASLRFRIATSQASRVILEVPESHPGMNPVLLRRLQHLGEGIGKAIALVTPSAEWRRMARELGVPAFPSREVALRASWPDDEAQEALVAAAGLTPAMRTWAEGRRWPLPQWAYILSLMIGGLGFLSVLFLVIFLFPSAEVTLKPQGQPVAITETLTADPRLAARDLRRGAIPAYPVAVIVEGRAETQATGRQEQPADYAQGQVVLVNQTARPVEVPAGTVVRAASGNVTVRFVISPSVTVPAGFGATAVAQVRALEPGPVGNVGPNQINLVEGPLAFALRVSNPEPLSGGRLKIVPVVTAADRDRVREALIAQLRQQGYAQMLAGLEPQDCVLPQTLQVEVLLE
ncbi:MAG: baseplate J/gp47 family protein, partial [Thermoflexus sp.]